MVNHQRMVNWWFGARWLGFLGSPYYIGDYTPFGHLILSVDHEEGSFIWTHVTWWDVGAWC